MDSKPTEDDGNVLARPPAYIYAMPRAAVDAQEWQYMIAKSNDSDLGVMPLIENLTVEPSFEYNVMCITGLKSNGFSAKSYITKLNASHYYPSVLIFHGGDAIQSSSEAPELTRLCQEVRQQFGFSTFSPQNIAKGIKETTTTEICEKIGVKSEETILYLAVTSIFKEVVYLCNTFIHYGHVEHVNIRGHKVAKIPLYPVQMYMLDNIKLCNTPFTPNARLLLEEAVYPQPFFNHALHNLMFDYIISNMAVVTRMRDVDAVARGMGYLAFDGNFEGCTISGNKSYLDLGPKTTGNSKMQNELRMADSMSSELAINMMSLFDTAMHDHSSQLMCSYDEWPLFDDANTPEERLQALSNFFTRVATHVGASIFSSNSVLYMLEIYDSLAKKDAATQKEPSPYDRFFLFNGAYLGANSRTDAEGVIIDKKDDVPIEFSRGRQPEFTLSHLVYGCGFCPQVVARVLFFLERCDRLVTSKFEQNLVKYVAMKREENVCKYCDASTSHCCAATTFFKLKNRMPIFLTPKKYSLAITGVLGNQYSELDPLGNYASFSAIRRQHDKDTAKNIMRDTYRAANDNIMKLLEKDKKYICRDTGTDSDDLSSIIYDRTSFMEVISEINQIVKAEADRFIMTLSEDRDFKFKESIRDANHCFSISCNPYLAAVCPVMTYLHYRTLMVVIQDLGLAHCSGIISSCVETKGARNMAQPLLKKKVMGMLNKGFFATKDLTVTLKCPFVTSFNPHKGIMESENINFEFELTKTSLVAPKELKIKNRIIFRGGNGSMTGDARGRFQAINAAFTRGDKINNSIINGPFGWLLKKFHNFLFPIKKGTKQIPALAFWGYMQQGKLPVEYLDNIPEVTAFVGFLKKESMLYHRCNMIDIMPNNLYTYAQFKFANLLLDMCGYKTNYICTISSVVAAIKKCNPSTATHLMGNVAKTPQEVDTLKDVAEHKRLSTVTFTSNTNKWIMDKYPIITCGVNINKYTGAQTGDTIFQSGNLGNLIGDGIDPTMSIRDPKRKFILVCPRVGFIIKNQYTGDAVVEKSLGELVQNLIKEGRPDVMNCIFSLLVKYKGDAIKSMSEEDFMTLVEDEYIATQLINIKDRLVAEGIGWTPAEISDFIAADEPTESTDFFNFQDCYCGDALTMDVGKKRKAIEEMLDDEPTNKKMHINIDDML